MAANISLLYSHLPAVIISLFIGFYLFVKDRRLETKIFLGLVIVFCIFTLGDLTEWFSFLGRNVVMFTGLILEISDPALLVFSFYFLFVVINKRDLVTKYKVLWLLPLISYAILVTVSLVLNLFTYNWDICEYMEHRLVTISGYYLYIFYVSSILLLAIWSIIKSKGHRRSVSLIAAGVSLFVLLFFTMEYILTGYVFGNAFNYQFFYLCIFWNATAHCYIGIPKNA